MNMCSQDMNKISIHALLAESDFWNGKSQEPKRHFYPRSPCGERLIKKTIAFNPPIFLSTLSLRRATLSAELRVFSMDYFYPRSPCGERRSPLSHAISLSAYFYPRSPCGERPWQRGSRITYVEISIHALLAESDQPWGPRPQPPRTFLSTLSLRRATCECWTAPNHLLRISIHALLAESDSQQPPGTTRTT